MATITAIAPIDEQTLRDNFLRAISAVEDKFQTRTPKVNITLVETEPGYFSLLEPNYCIDGCFATTIYEDEIQDCISELEAYLDGYFTCYDRMNVKNMTSKPTIIASKADIEGYFADITISNEEASVILDAIADRMNVNEGVMEYYWSIVSDEVTDYVKEHLESICVKACNGISIYEDEYNRALRIMDQNRCPLRHADDSIYDRIDTAISDVLDKFGIDDEDEDVIIPDPEEVFLKCDFKFNED